MEENKKPEININNWLSGKSQTQVDNFFTQEFGFRTDIIHFNNEWQYRIFNKANTKKVIVGKDNYLFSKRYIDAYMGNDFIGVEEVEKRSNTLLEINKKIETAGKTLIVVIAPGKGSFYSEYIPDRFYPKNETTNHEALGKAYESKGLNFIDFNSLFLAMKDTSSYPLYPKTGIHWSEYGLTFMADSLIKYVEKIKKVDLPGLKIHSTKVTPTAQGIDIDIEKSMNLIWKIPSDSMAYPHIVFDKEKKDSLKVLMVADSFYWQLFNAGISRQAFNKSLFFFYNRTFHPKPKDSENQVENLDLTQIVNQYDVFVLMATEANLVNFPWKFDEHILEVLNEKTNE